MADEFDKVGKFIDKMVEQGNEITNSLNDFAKTVNDIGKVSEDFHSTLNTNNNIYKSYNVELKASLNDTNILQNSLNSTLYFLNTELGKLGATAFGLGRLLSPSVVGEFYQGIGDDVYKYDELLAQANRTLGISGSRVDQIESNFSKILPIAARLNLSYNDLIDIQNSYNKEIGTSNILLTDELNKLSQIKSVFGDLDIGNLAARAELYGISINRTYGVAQDLLDLSDRYGINAAKVTKTLFDNVEKIQTFKFEGGVESFAKMVVDSENMKLNVSSMLDVANNFRTLEDSFERVSKLQLLGGEFTKADPFQLTHLARTNVPEFSKQLSSLFGQIGTFNQKTGELEFSSIEIDKIREVSNIVGLNTNEIIQNIKQQDKYNKIKQVGNNLTDDEIMKLTNLSKFDDKIGEYVVQVKGNIVEVDDLTNTQLKDIMNAEDVGKEIGERFNNQLSVNEFSETMTKLGRSYELSNLQHVKGYREANQENYNKFFNLFRDAGISDEKSIEGAALVAKSISDSGKIIFDKSNSGFIKQIEFGSRLITGLINNSDNFINKLDEITNDPNTNKKYNDLLNTLGITNNEFKEISDKVKSNVKTNEEGQFEQEKVLSYLKNTDVLDTYIKKINEQEQKYAQQFDKIQDGNKKTIEDSNIKLDNLSEMMYKSNKKLIDEFTNTLKTELPKIISESIDNETDVNIEPMTINVNVSGDMVKVTREVIKLTPKVRQGISN